MINIQNIENVSDCVPLYLPHSLYLKPLAKMQISVGLPTNKTGKSISNLEIMEKLSAELKPDKFLVLKVSKSTVNCIRFEAELDENKRLRNAISRLDGTSLRISGFSESFRVRCNESKDEFPTRHDWDSYFRDARNMDEMKAGERPDTIHITHLPIRWFCPRHLENENDVKPSESIFRRIFEKFGRIRCVDIPICDVYRSSMNSDINGMRTFSFEQDVLFEGYVQFEEYAGFVRAMDEFRGTKLVRKFVDKTQSINIHVTFDTTKHLGDAQITRRDRVRKRLIAKAQSEEAEIERQKKLEQERLERERQKEEQLKLAELEKQREREEKRKEKHLKKIQERGQIEISQKIRVEERKLMIAQRKLESIRILEQLFQRIQNKNESKHSRSRDAAQNQKRERLVQKYKFATEELLHSQRQIVADIKSKTPLMGLLKSKSLKKNATGSSDDEDDTASKKLKLNSNDTNAIAGATGTGTANNVAAAAVLNPFKAVAALAAAGAGQVPTVGAPGAAAAAAYTAEAASEWMKSLSMFPYGVPAVFPGVAPGLYRPPTHFAVSSNYRGFAPRIRGRGGRGGRSRGRGGYDGHSSSSSYYNKHYHDDRYDDENGGYYKSSYSSRGRHRSRSSSYSRSRSRSYGRSRRRSHSRSRSRSHSHYRKSSYSSRSRNRSRSHTHSRSRSKSPATRTNKKLVSTRRSRTASESSRSRSRSYRSKRSWSRRGERRSDRRSRSNSSHRVVLAADELLNSAEKIKATIEHHTKERMREEEREIRQNFRTQKHSQTKLYDSYDDLKLPENDLENHRDTTSSKHDNGSDAEHEGRETSVRRRSTSSRQGEIAA